MSILIAVEEKSLLVSMLDPRNHLTRLFLCSSTAAAHHYTAVPGTPNCPGVDSCANEQEMQMTNRPPSLHSPEYASQHQIFVFLLIPLLSNSLASWGICVTFPGKYPWIPHRYLWKEISEREIFQDWTASFSPNIFPGVCWWYVVQCRKTWT